MFINVRDGFWNLKKEKNFDLSESTHLNRATLPDDGLLQFVVAKYYKSVGQHLVTVVAPWSTVQEHPKKILEKVYKQVYEVPPELFPNNKHCIQQFAIVCL